MVRRLGSFAAFVTFALSGCGGGGGSSNGGQANSPPPPDVGYTLSATSIMREVVVTEVAPVTAEIAVRSTNSAAQPFGFGGQLSRNGLGSLLYEPTGSASGTLVLFFKLPASLAPGIYTDTVTFGACVDEFCRAIAPASTSTINVTYSVTAATLPTVTMSTSALNVIALAGDTSPTRPVNIMATVSNPVSYAVSGIGSSTTTNGVHSVTYEGTSNTEGKLTVHFKMPSNLEPGTYTDTITVRMCLFWECANPLDVTPSTITVTYVITDTVDGPAGYTTKLTTEYAADFAWDETRSVLYLAVPGDAPSERAGSVTAFDPATNTYLESVGTIDPALLALSDDDGMLYVAERRENVVRRFIAGPLTPDITIPLGNLVTTGDPLVAKDIKVAPDRPNLLAARLSNVNAMPYNGWFTLFDDATPRTNTVFQETFPTGVYAQWGMDATRLYTNSGAIAVDADGLTPLSNYPAVTGHFERVGDRIFSVWGEVTDIASGAGLEPMSRLGYPNVSAADPVVGRVYLVTYTPEYDATQIETYDANTLERIGVGRLPKFGVGNNTPARAVRWGRDGLAIAMNSYHVVLVTGPLIVP